MTELLISHTKSRGKIFERVLELGSGCGYQSAILSYFCVQVDAIERIKPLVQKSRENLADLKIEGIQRLEKLNFSVDYFLFCNSTNLEELLEFEPDTLVAIAVKLGNVRLIDNFIIQ